MFKTTADLIAFVIICTFLFLLLITLVTIFVLKFQQRKISFITEINKLNLSHHTELLKVEIEVQEQTFQNISREIHDNISQKLTLAKLRLNLLKGENLLFIETLQETINNITEVIKDLSDLSRSISSDLIHGNGLIKAVEFEVSQLNKLNLFKVTFQILGEPYFLKEKSELFIFRIIQEALNNVIKHANASNIAVVLNYNIDRLIIQIKDDGIGLVNIDTENTHMGLKNMARRAEFLHGSMKIESKPSKGTIIYINIPKNE